MSKFVLFAFTLLFAASVTAQSVSVTVKNGSALDRENEIVSVDWQLIQKKLALKEEGGIVVLNSENKQVPFQLIYNGKATIQNLIFPASVKQKSTQIYTIQKGKPETFQRKTFGRPVPERKDDFAWENDRIAFRMYGPALTPEFPSNGVDVWLKRTSDLIVDKFYEGDLKHKISYHVDHGQGLDCYKVGHTVGAGGLAPFVKDSLWIGGAYKTAKVLDSGILRTTFELYYDSIPVNGKLLKERLVISLDANSQLNKAVVSYEGDFTSFPLAAGIWIHPDGAKMKIEAAQKINKQLGYIALAENAFNDSGLASGRSYVGVVIPKAVTDVKQRYDNLLAFSNYMQGRTFTYYFGAGWSKWGVENDSAWFTYMDRFAARLQSPLMVMVK